MANFLHWTNISRAAIALLMISVCAKSLLNRSIPFRLQRGLSAIRFRSSSSNPTTMASAEPEPQMEGQADSLAPPQPQSPTTQELRKLSPSDYRIFNCLAEHMDYFVSPDHSFSLPSC
jgi:hypothetical protein